ncbi:CbrC family protein [Clostridium sp. ZS1]|uniref:CbrC family protein n=1 Tax=Clostridium sp. ZS1 TaxID=2949989 RepID=UPI00207A8062|nr:CbrC family protein [Clostridium sp. ZS1]
MNNNYNEIYLKLEEDFLKEKATIEEVDKLYDFMHELESKLNKSIDIEKVLVNTYSLLQYHEKAYRCYAKVAEKNNKRDRKRLSELRKKSDLYKDRLAIRRRNEITKSFIGKIPKFKYCPDTINTNILTVGGAEVCDCCGETVDIYYEGSLYCIEDVDCLCPECIFNGMAAKKFNGEFQQDLFNNENVVNEEYDDEILHRTPSYMSWQGSNWPAHCDDYCEFLGDAEWKDIEKIDMENNLENFTGWTIEELKEYLSPNGSLCGYLFRCLKCGKYCLCADCD